MRTTDTKRPKNTKPKIAFFPGVEIFKWMRKQGDLYGRRPKPQWERGAVAWFILVSQHGEVEATRIFNEAQKNLVEEVRNHPEIYDEPYGE